MHSLVFLPGMMCDARLFAPQIAALKQQGFTVSVGDITCADTMYGLAQNVLSNAPPRFALCGLSMGGIVAMEIMRQAPERVSAIALLDTNPLAETTEMQARRGPQMARVNAGGLEAMMRDELKPNYLVDGPEKPAILDLCMDMAMTLGPEVFIHQSLALRDRPDQSETLKAITVPSLILCGQEDRLCPPARHQLMHDLMPHAALIILENAGHLPTLERPTATTQHLQQWLAQLPAA